MAKSEVISVGIVACILLIFVGSVSIAQLAIGAVHHDSEDAQFATRWEFIGLCNSPGKHDVQPPLNDSWYTQVPVNTNADDDVCVRACGYNGIGFGLATWNIVSGVIGLFSLGLVVVMVGLTVKGHKAVIALLIPFFAITVFQFCWWIVGILSNLLAMPPPPTALEVREFSSPVPLTASKNTARFGYAFPVLTKQDMTVAALVLQGLGIFGQLCQAPKKK